MVDDRCCSGVFISIEQKRSINHSRESVNTILVIHETNLVRLSFMLANILVYEYLNFIFVTTQRYYIAADVLKSPKILREHRFNPVTAGAAYIRVFIFY